MTVRKGADRPSAPKNVVNLMDALRRSVANDSGKPLRPAKPKKRAAAQGEMLMSIAGSKDVTKKPAAQSTSRRKAG